MVYSILVKKLDVPFTTEWYNALYNEWRRHEKEDRVSRYCRAPVVICGGDCFRGGLLCMDVLSKSRHEYLVSGKQRAIRDLLLECGPVFLSYLHRP